MISNQYSGYITRRQLVATSVFWLALPLIIFLTTWIRPIIGWPLALAVSVCLYRSIKNLKDSDTPVIYIDRVFWIMVVLMFLFTVYAGIGGLFYQEHWDHGFRNAIYVWRWIKGNVFFWLMFITVSIIPFFVLTKESDLGCRVGIPLTFYFSLIVLKSVTYIRSWSKLKIACFAMTYFIGVVATSGMYYKNIFLHIGVCSREVLGNSIGSLQFMMRRRIR